MSELKIDQEFKTLIPPLTSEEYQQLTDNIIKEGCRDALIIWNGILIDGHNRYEICKFNNIAFRTEEKFFDTHDEVKEWIIRNQFGRRNLSVDVRVKLAFRLEELIKVRAKEKQVAGLKKGNSPVLVPGLKREEKIHTDIELAKIAGVSAKTIQRARVVEREATPEQKRQLETGEKKIKTVYNEIRPKEDKLVKLFDKPKIKEMEVKKEEPSAPQTEGIPKESILSISRFSLIVNHFVSGINPLQFVHERFAELSKKDQEDFFWNIKLAKEELASVEEHLKKFTEVKFND